jgi:hypothetical protein
MMIETWWGERECPSLEAYYDERCLFPIDIYEGITGKPVAMILRLGTALRKYEALRSIRRNRFACIVANSARSSGERVSDASHLMRIFGRPCVTGGPSPGPQRRTAQDSANVQTGNRLLRFAEPSVRQSVSIKELGRLRLTQVPNARPGTLPIPADPQTHDGSLRKP